MYETENPVHPLAVLTHGEGAVLEQAAEVIADGVGTAAGPTGRIQAPFGVHLIKLDENREHCWWGGAKETEN